MENTGTLNRNEHHSRSNRIEILDISGRAYNALLRANIRTIEQAAHLSHEELLRLNGVGTVSATEIETEIRRFLASPIQYPQGNGRDGGGADQQYGGSDQSLRQRWREHRKH